MYIYAQIYKYISYMFPEFCEESSLGPDVYIILCCTIGTNKNLQILCHLYIR